MQRHINENYYILLLNKTWRGCLVQSLLWLIVFNTRLEYCVPLLLCKVIYIEGVDKVGQFAYQYHRCWYMYIDYMLNQ